MAEIPKSEPRPWGNVVVDETSAREGGAVALPSPHSPRGIGGSDAAAIAGLNPWRSPVQVWLEYTVRIERPDESEAMYWGTTLEPLIAAETERRAEVTILPAPADGFASERFPWLVGHPDGFVGEWANRDDPTTRGIFEAKCVGLRSANQW
jgi:hypothetical protein